MLSTILGLVLSLGIMALAIMSKDAKLILLFLDLPSAMIVMGCSFAALMTNFTFPELFEGMKSMQYAFKKMPPPPSEVIDLMVNLAVKARREGMLGLQTETTNGRFPMLDLGVGLLADGTDPESTAQILETSSSAGALKEAKGERLWRDLSVYAPMFGMMGTLIGLILMLRGLSDPSTIGPAMAIALVTTLYGVIVAGLFCLPLAGKIHNYFQRVALLRELIIEGILSIQAGNNSQIISEKLKAHTKGTV
ncbi:MAG: MotA/TolQ/ExbB proton channel family protein [Candidatus Omnitrophota bacterium]